MIKSKLYNLLEGAPRNTRSQRIFDFVLITLILANVLAVIVGTVEGIATQYKIQFYIFELFSVAVFTLELALRF